MSDKYPYYCVEPDCGISDCTECPFNPVVLQKEIKALERKGIATDIALGNHYDLITDLKEKYKLNEQQYKIIYNSIHGIEKLSGEKELPKTENGINHSHGINSDTSVSDSKPESDELGLPLDFGAKTTKQYSYYDPKEYIYSDIDPDEIKKNTERIEKLEKTQFENNGDSEIIKSHAEQIGKMKDKLLSVWAGESLRIDEIKQELNELKEQFIQGYPDVDAIYHELEKNKKPESNLHYDEEPWDCPICHGTVHVGYFVHRDCIDGNIIISRELLENIIEYISCEPRHEMADGDLKMLVELENLKKEEEKQ